VTFRRARRVALRPPATGQKLVERDREEITPERRPWLVSRRALKHSQERLLCELIRLGTLPDPAPEERPDRRAIPVEERLERPSVTALKRQHQRLVSGHSSPRL
jgi:hypothetical protein